jgi:hypothetical protein
MYLPHSSSRGGCENPPLKQKKVELVDTSGQASDLPVDERGS